MMNRITAYQIAKNKVLLGLTGKPLVNVDHIRNFIAIPGRFASYSFKPSKFAPKGTHTIDIAELQSWNDKIRQRLATTKKMFHDIKP